ncbi:reverse transcriptase/maturase family protein [Streptomyces sp. NPDC101490]|uniref:reverse transcriptase/maturase family protein n=1 Tax=Streptomyces sp. NPDC101490 TaxID=3366143 RepID=UPI0038203AE9
MKAFLKAGILGEDHVLRETSAGTPQGSILSPLLSNVALSVLDEHIAHAPGGPEVSASERAKRRRKGLPNYRLIRYADDWCLVVSGTEADAEALREEIAGVLSVMGLRLSAEKTLITHIDGASTSSAGAPSATASEARPSSTSTPIPRARPFRP